ncbi:30S ribosome-binding factor RbfA [Pararhodospirillum oryzae]|uniref:Ribosome-binding factor A n=1 Tax=Pararhodospirillum oryzae TaxID=478448 RepID=A0A512HAB0_9PROT|nr:30S ribosome-binding factor RbfA [Pararhodospirillum oryzae]GEO82330.1 ribosome-binding factor A [Pararhodospirillum oryzae]
MPRSIGKAPSQRQLRVGEEIRHALAEVFERGDIHEPALAGLALTVSEVRVSPDLRAATAFVMRLGGGDMNEVLAGLRRAKPFLRHCIAARLTTRYTPDLRFEPDESFDEAGHIAALLQDPVVRRDLEGTPAATGDEEQDSDPDDDRNDDPDTERKGS